MAGENEKILLKRDATGGFMSAPTPEYLAAMLPWIVVIRNDKAVVVVSADRWSRQAIRDVLLAVRQISLGELRGLIQGYYAKKGSGIIGVTAAHQHPACLS